MASSKLSFLQAKYPILLPLSCKIGLVRYSSALSHNRLPTPAKSTSCSISANGAQASRMLLLTLSTVLSLESAANAYNPRVVSMPSKHLLKVVPNSRNEIGMPLASHREPENRLLNISVIESRMNQYRGPLNLLAAPAPSVNICRIDS